MKKFSILIIFSVLFICCNKSSIIYKPTELDVIGDYVHESTLIVFPKSINDLVRTEIISFDKNKTNIGVSYKTTNGSVTIYIYPAGIADADRLKSEFYSSLKSIATISGKEIEASQSPFEYSKKRYALIGLNAEIGKNNLSEKSILTLFECGKWFLKIRITSNQSELSELYALRDTIIAHFSPVDIVQRYPLKQKVNILFAPAILNDSLMMYSVMMGAFKHSSWVLQNVDSLQRCSGFPGLYLTEYTESLLAMVEGSKNRTRFKGPRDPDFDEFIQSLSKIIENGYLNEFVMDEYNMLLITPENLTLNLDGYRRWAGANIKHGILDTRYYIIEYKE